MKTSSTISRSFPAFGFSFCDCLSFFLFLCQGVTLRWKAGAGRQGTEPLVRASIKHYSSGGMTKAERREDEVRFLTDAEIATFTTSYAPLR